MQLFIPKDEAERILTKRASELKNIALDIDSWVVTLERDVQKIFGSGEELVSIKRISSRVFSNPTKINQYADLISSLLDKIETSGVPSELNQRASKTHIVQNDSISKFKILFLASNPTDSSRLRLDEELRELEIGLQNATQRENFTLVSKWAVTPKLFQQAIIREKPSVIHFSGHGSAEGIILEDINGDSKQLTLSAISALLSPFKTEVKCVILNSCYSERQALEIAKFIPFVIGMNNSINDKSAIHFAVGFYGALGEGRDIKFAFEMGKALILMEDSPGHDIPILISKIGT